LPEVEENYFGNNWSLFVAGWGLTDSRIVRVSQKKLFKQAPNFLLNIFS